jgi:hypothetical protein
MNWKANCQLFYLDRQSYWLKSHQVRHNSYSELWCLLEWPRRGRLRYRAGQVTRIPSAWFSDHSLFNQRVPVEIPAGNFDIRINHGYNAADNFGQVVHTYTGYGTGWEFIRSSGSFGFSGRYIAHPMSLEITYQVDVTDIQ